MNDQPKRNPPRPGVFEPRSDDWAKGALPSHPCTCGHSRISHYGFGGNCSVLGCNCDAWVKGVRPKPVRP